jgi:hypothetical protein
MLTDEEIEAAKKKTCYSLPAHHEHADCIRFVYEWLDAQWTVRGKSKRPIAIKLLVAQWAGRYVSTSDVEVAAEMHPRISGKYPNFNISAKLVLPSRDRISMLSQAFTQEYNQFRTDNYAFQE